MTNRKYTNKRIQMSDADIEKFKDFDRVLNKVNSNPPDNSSGNSGNGFDFKQFLKHSKNVFLGIAGVAAVVIGFKLFPGKADSTTVTELPATVIVDSIENNTPAIAPPIPGAETPFSIYTINAQNEEVITTPTGTRILVKKNTFKDLDGQVIKGKVEIRFREYHNVLDIFKSGIPMEYDSSGVSYTFESAGMFELEAMKDGAEILNFDKDIEVEIVSENSSTDFNDYYYDTASRKWEFMARSTISETKEVMPEVAAIAAEDENIATAEVIKQANVNVEAPAPAVQPTAPTPLVYPPLLSSKYAFEVEYDRSKFSEIHSGAVFQVDETQSAFSPVFYKVNWDKLELSRAESKGMYSLHLEKGSQILDVACFPAITKEEQTRIRMRYEAANKAYQDSLAVWNAYVASLRPNMNQWGQGDDHMISKTEVELITKLTYRKVAISRAGVYNCDKPIYTQKYLGDKVKATFNNGNVKSLRNYVVERNKNALFAARNGDEVMLSKNKDLLVWVWTTDHQIGIVNPAQLKDYKLSQNFDLQLYTAKNGLKKLEELLEG